LIDKEKLLEELDKKRKSHIDDYNLFVDEPEAQYVIAHCLQELYEVREMVENLPSVRGEWIYDENGNDWGLGAWVCSRCGCKNDNLSMDSRVNPYRFAGSKFCPNCGADMRKKVD